jgi:hypothetical protein
MNVTASFKFSDIFNRTMTTGSRRLHNRTEEERRRRRT